MNKKVEADMKRRINAISLIQQHIVDENSDAVSLILRAHLLAEHLIEGLLESYLEEKAKPILELELNFYKKLQLIEGYELLPKNLIISIKKLNKLRNRCAHTLGMKITNEEIKPLFAEIIEEMPYGDTMLDEEEIKVLMLRYMGWLAGYLAPKTWE